MRTLITGGAGFIGSHIADLYLEHGHEVMIVDDLSSGRRENIPAGATFVEIDIRSPELRAVIAEWKPEVINHHAAQKSVPASVEDPLHDADLNVMGFVNLVTAGIAAGTRRFVYASSGGALTSPSTPLPAPEDAPPSLVSPYAVTKLAGEHYLHSFSQLHGIEYIVLRYANVMGPRQHADGECGVVPIFVGNVLAGKPSKLFAYPDMPDGCTRDYVYVGDVARANLLALDHGKNAVVHIGTASEISMAALYQKVADICGSDVPLLREGPRLGDIKRSALDVSRAKDVLGWEPLIDTDEGLRLTVEAARAEAS